MLLPNLNGCNLTSSDRGSVLFYSSAVQGEREGRSGRDKEERKKGEKRLIDSLSCLVAQS